MGESVARWLLCVLLLWFSTGSLRAQAESGGFALRLEAPVGSGCVDAAALTALLETRTGRAASGSAAAPAIHVQIEAAANGYRAEVSRSGSQRELVVDGDCSELAEALVVVIASSLGIREPLSKPAPARAQRIQPVDPPPSAALPNISHTRERDASPDPLQLDVVLAARVLTGIMPRPAFGPGLAWLAQWRALGIRVGATFLPSAAYPVQGGLALEVVGGWAELGLCGRAAGGSPWSALFCAEINGGPIRANVEPLRHGVTRWDALVMAVPRVEARVQATTWLGASVGLGAAIPLIFPRYAHRNEQAEAITAHTPELGVFVELALWLKILP
jgi:hypothetical protein